MTSFDLFIFNKGLSGLILAYALNKYFRIAIINQDIDTIQNKEYSFFKKISFVNIASIKILKYLKIWNKDIELLLNSVSKLEIFRQSNFFYDYKKLSFNSGYLGYSELGYVVNYKMLQNLLLNYVKRLKNITFLNTSVTLTSISYNVDEVLIVLSNNLTYTVKLVIFTDKVSFYTRNSINFPFIFKNMKYYGLTAVAHISKKHENTLRCVSHHDGIITLLPLKDSNLYFVFWILSMSMAKKYLYEKSKHEYYFNHDLTQFYGLLGKISLSKIDNFVNIFQLKMQYIHNFVKHRFIFLGETTHTMCPFFLKNINIECMDAIILYNCLKSIKENNSNFSDNFYLQSYNDYKKFNITKIITDITCFYINYCYNDDLIKYIESIFYHLIKVIPNYKMYILEYFMGLNNLPSFLINKNYNN